MMDNDKVRDFSEEQLNKKFSVLVASMLDAERRESWEEYEAFSRMVDRWKREFILSEAATEQTGEYSVYMLSPLPELRTKKRMASWFRVMCRILRDTFEVGIILAAPGRGVYAKIVTKNPNIAQEVQDLAATLQTEMLLFYKALKPRSKPQYFLGFMDAILFKFYESNSRIEESVEGTEALMNYRYQEALDWYKQQHGFTMINRPMKVNAKSESFAEGAYDGKTRGTRVESKAPTIKLLGSINK